VTTSYKEHFIKGADAERYDQQEYASGSYSELLWELEQMALKTLLEGFLKTHPRPAYLDFASGTGRVAGFLENQVGSATAIEISESMAPRARQRLKRSRVLCRDITAAGAELEGKYDLITAFRFFLNAEPELRLKAAKALAARLQDDQSWLILNNHGNLWSLKLAGWPYHRLRNRGRGWQPRGNYLRHSEVERLLKHAGLQIIKRKGLGVMGGKLCRCVSFDQALRVESKLASIPLFSSFGQDQIYVACLKSDKGR
jgi:SAM-dependent methyltransferase